MITTIIIVIFVFIFVAILEIRAALQLRKREYKLEERIKYVDAREDAARTAMRRNGATAEALNQERKRLEERSEVVERRNVENMKTAAENIAFADSVRADIKEYKRFKDSLVVFVYYLVSEEDRKKYADDKLPAVAKSRIANKLGHAILKKFPDSMYREVVDGNDMYAVKIFVKTKMEDEK